MSKIKICYYEEGSNIYAFYFLCNVSLYLILPGVDSSFNFV